MRGFQYALPLLRPQYISTYWPDHIKGTMSLKISILHLHFLNINFGLANSVDPDEMTRYVAFRLGLHCLPKCVCLLVLMLYVQVNIFQSCQDVFLSS